MNLLMNIQRVLAIESDESSTAWYRSFGNKSNWKPTEVYKRNEERQNYFMIFDAAKKIGVRNQLNY